MANQLILPPQKFKFSDLTSQFPSAGSPRKKVFFQSELRSLVNGDAVFGVVAYPSWKEGNKWVVGTKVSGTDTGVAAPKPFVPPLAFANNEIVLAVTLIKKGEKTKKKKKKKKEPRKGRWNGLLKMTRKICKDKKMLEESFFHFEAGISDNPHLEYNVTLEINGSSLRVSTKPSPPAPPES